MKVKRIVESEGAPLDNDLWLHNNTLKSKSPAGQWENVSGSSTGESGFIQVQNPDPEKSDNVGLVSSLSEKYSKNIGKNATIEGEGTKQIPNEASGDKAHCEGGANKATGHSSHCEGSCSEANGVGSHAEGYYNIADGQYSHAAGNQTHAVGEQSHTEGHHTVANAFCEFSCGFFNSSTRTNEMVNNPADTLFSVGNGSDTNHRRNALEVTQDGSIYILVNGVKMKLQDYIPHAITLTGLPTDSTNSVEALDALGLTQPEIYAACIGMRTGLEFDGTFYKIDSAYYNTDTNYIISFSHASRQIIEGEVVYVSGSSFYRVIRNGNMVVCGAFVLS